jgi:hypothetical protein
MAKLDYCPLAIRNRREREYSMMSILGDQKGEKICEVLTESALSGQEMAEDD